MKIAVKVSKKQDEIIILKQFLIAFRVEWLSHQFQQHPRKQNHKTPNESEINFFMIKIFTVVGALKNRFSTSRIFITFLPCAWCALRELSMILSLCVWMWMRKSDFPLGVVHSSIYWYQPDHTEIGNHNYWLKWKETTHWKRKQI